MNRIIKLLLFNFLILVSLISTPLLAVCEVQRPRVTVVLPDKDNGTFWSTLASFMRPAAEDLQVELKTIFTDKPGERYFYLQAIKAELESENPPDYIIHMPFNRQLSKLLPIAEKAKVKTFVFNTPVPKEETALGKPREKFKYWIGNSYADIFTAGGLLATELAKAVRKRLGMKDDTVIKLVAIGGSRDSATGVEEHKGLNAAIETDASIKLNQFVYTDWSQERAAYATQGLLSRYPDTHAVWAASDRLAVGTLEAVKKHNEVNTDPILIGSIGWTQNSLAKIYGGERALNLGGHFMEGAWTLILLHDYHYGIDFADDLGVTFDHPLQLIDSGNIEKLLLEFGEWNWKQIDFRRFSKIHNNDLKKYDFSLENVFLENNSRLP
jgi:ABC-type sugar transport system substrate-binding protein